MARAHAVSGAAGWLAICDAATVLHRPLPAAVVAFGAVVATGSAVIPDGDHPSSTIARSFGPPSQWVCRQLAKACAKLHARTKTPLDGPRGSGHRTVTHTGVFAVALGVVVLVGCAVAGRYAAAVVAFVCAGLAARAILSPKDRVVRVRYRSWFMREMSAALPWLRRAPIVPPLVGSIAAAWALQAGPSTPWWWLGAPVAFGCLAHCFGDAITNSGCPILWPIRIAGYRWYLLGTPRAWRFGAGSAVERLVVLPVLALASLASAGWLISIT